MLDKIRNSKHSVVLMIGVNHIFAVDRVTALSNVRDAFHEGEFKALRIQKSLSVSEVAHNYCSKGVGKGKFIVESLLYVKRARAFIYYDFETTYMDGYFEKKGVSQRYGLNSYEQVEFAFSMITDCKIRFRTIVESLAREWNIKSYD